jgi:hypothetical protein
VQRALQYNKNGFNVKLFNKSIQWNSVFQLSEKRTTELRISSYIVFADEHRPTKQEILYVHVYQHQEYTAVTGLSYLKVLINCTDTANHFIN